MVRRRLRPIAALGAAFLAANAPQLTSAELENNTGHDRRIDIGVVHSDEMADAVMTVRASKPVIGIGPDDHATITSILASTRELVEMAALLVQNRRTLREGQDLMEQASAKLLEVKRHIGTINRILRLRVEEEEDEERRLLRKKFADHDVRKTHEEGARSLDVSRNMYETIITFPECVERLFEDCVDVINAELDGLGLPTIEMVVREKRNADQENYNKVVIVTNEAADRVAGRAGDGIVTYPYPWKDSELGDRTVGVDGKWSCLNMAPVDCCATIKSGVPNPDIHGKYIECHIFVPFGGIGNQRRSDRVFVNLSSDGRVHETPFIS